MFVVSWTRLYQRDPFSFMNAIAGDAKNRVWVLLIVVFVSRLLFALLIWRQTGPSGFTSPDTPTYILPAQSLITHGSFSSHETPEISRTPGYPLLLVPAVAFSHPIAVGLLENFLLATASGVLIWLIVRDSLPASNAALWAIALYCLEPVGLLYSEQILSDTLFSSQLLLFVWLGVRFLRKPSYTNLVLAALALGAATYTRPVTLYLGLWLAPLLLFLPGYLTRGQKLARAILFPLLFALTLAPWILRNARVSQYPGFSSISDNGLYAYDAAAVKARLEHKNFVEAQKDLGVGDEGRYFESHPEQRSWPMGRIAKFQRAEATRIILRHLATYSLIHAHGCAVVVLAPGTTEMLTVLGLYAPGGGLLARALDQGIPRATLGLIHQNPVAGVSLALMGAQLLVYYWLGLKGLRRMPPPVRALLVSLSLYLVLVSGQPLAVARYRVPIMPLVCIAAGVAITSRQSRKSEELRAAPANLSKGL